MRTCEDKEVYIQSIIAEKQRGVNIKAAVPERRRARPQASRGSRASVRECVLQEERDPEREPRPQQGKIMEKGNAKTTTGTYERIRR